MGCDIHCYSERRVDGRWVCDQADSYTEEIEEAGTEDEYIYRRMNKFYRDRDYWLFGLLNKGVRTEWAYSFKEKGFPEGSSSQITQIYEQWNSDAHSPNYLTLRELKEKAAEILIHPQDEATQHHLKHLQQMIVKLTQLPGESDDVRIVFWFDN